MASETLVVGAYAPEVAGLPAGVRAAAVGIGAVDGAAGLARRLAEGGTRRVILVGTCGAFPDVGLARGDLVVVDSARWVCPDEGVEVPEVVVTEAPATEALAARLAAATGARRVTAACGPGVTVDAESTARLARASGAQVEHMECFAVYRTCALFDVDVCALLGVANLVGPGARQEWARHHRAVEAAAVDALGRALPEL